MTNLNTSIILCKGIKLDSKYKNVINYSEANMLALCNATTHKIASSSTYSFIKHGENVINTDFTYGECMGANYIAFKNTDYFNKWFFAFIDKVEFVSPKMTKIYFTVDVWSTFFSSITLSQCFVIREHVNDDTLGKYTIPEGIEQGDYIVNSYLADNYNNDRTIIIGTTEDYLNNYEFGMNVYTGIPAPLFYYRYDDASTIQYVLEGLANDGKTGSIVSMFIAPKWLCPYADSTVRVATSNTVSTITLGVNRISSLNGYTPKNKKLLCYPYCYIGISNVVGQYNTLKQEVWELDNNEMKIQLMGSLVAGASIKAIPLNYNGVSSNINEGITIGKFPILAWPNDLYTNWETQNGVNILGIPVQRTTGGLIRGGTEGIIGAIRSDYSQIGSGIGNMLSAINESYQHDIIPTVIEGSLNTGDVINASNNNRLFVFRVTIKKEYAKTIDDFFTLFGYKVNEVKIPNITGRTYWNFIQIGASEVIGYGDIPTEYEEKINEIARAGTTIWHNHDNIGNYSLNNTIVSS